MGKKDPGETQQCNTSNRRTLMLTGLAGGLAACATPLAETGPGGQPIVTTNAGKVQGLTENERQGLQGHSLRCLDSRRRAASARRDRPRHGPA